MCSSCSHRSSSPMYFCGLWTGSGEEEQPEYFIFCLFFCRLRHYFTSNIFSFFMDVVFGIKTKTIALPIGISFYTFQIVSYCVDVYHDRVARQKNLVTYAAYVTLFPQLVAGPIVRYSEIERTLTKGIDFSAFHETLSGAWCALQSVWAKRC